MNRHIRAILPAAVLAAVVLAAVVWTGPAFAAQPGSGANTRTEYSPLDAGRDAHRWAEQQRRWAVERQRQVQSDVIERNTLARNPFVDVTAAPGYRGVSRRYLRRMYNYQTRVPVGLPYPVYRDPWTYDPVLGSFPYYPLMRQPVGHRKVWTGPNSYVYQPIYANDNEDAAPSQSVPTGSEATSRRTPPATPPTEPDYPTADPGPREF